MNRAQVVALHLCRRRVRDDFRDVVSREVNRAKHRGQDIAGRRGIRTDGI
jgi:hypothetical protein